MSFEYDAEVTCDACQGDGGWDAPSGYYNHVTGALITHWRKCKACGGNGTYTVHMRPVDFEDLANIEDDDADPYSAFAYRGGNP